MKKPSRIGKVTETLKSVKEDGDKGESIERELDDAGSIDLSPVVLTQRFIEIKIGQAAVLFFDKF